MVQSFLIAFVARLPGIREVTERCGRLLQTLNFSSLSPAVARRSSSAFVRGLVEWLPLGRAPKAEELIGLDGMAVTLPKTQRHRCPKYNHKTVGGGVVWSYRIEAPKGCCPVQVLRIIDGAWHDTKVMRGVALVAHGPVYLMDRGFYCFELLADWLAQQVRFIVRVPERNLVYTPIRTLSKPRRIGQNVLTFDALVRLGGPQAQLHPTVRLLKARLPGGDSLALATDRFDWSAERLLEAYKKRYHIERFHRFLKDTVGLAHLYSFHQSGLRFLLYTALLLALLLFLADDGARAQTIAVLCRALKSLRRALGLGTAWKRNIATRRRAKKTAAKKERNV